MRYTIGKEKSRIPEDAIIHGTYIGFVHIFYQEINENMRCKFWNYCTSNNNIEILENLLAMYGITDTDVHKKRKVLSNSHP